MTFELSKAITAFNATVANLMMKSTAATLNNTCQNEQDVSDHFINSSKLKHLQNN